MVEPGQGPNAHHAPLAPGLRLTASDRPGMAQPVPQRDVPAQPWARIMLAVVLLVSLLTVGWEAWSRTRGFLPGDLGDYPSTWAEQWRRIDDAPVAIIGDSRILFDTDFARFEALTGRRPLQLALAGTNARPILEDIADKTAFEGLLIVGITEVSYYRPGIGLGAKAQKAGEWEAPSAKTSLILHREARRHLGFLEDDASLSTLVQHSDNGARKGLRGGPYNEVWKLEHTGEDRETALWQQIERDPFLRAHAIHMWMILYGLPGPTPELIAMTEAKTRAAVAKIRARGGEVVFVRPPSAPKLRLLEDQRAPRDKVWDKLLVAANVQGVHADDLPAARDLDIPELSHVSAACRPLFTDAYVRAIALLIPRLPLRADAPPPLAAGSCSPQTRVAVQGKPRRARAMPARFLVRGT
ncbi:conserved hypothetical protein [Novosphingobium sp. 9U]|nr:conserved hypothetical protein [Novosphingobium sp. 9U]